MKKYVSPELLVCNFTDEVVRTSDGESSLEQKDNLFELKNFWED